MFNHALAVTAARRTGGCAGRPEPETAAKSDDAAKGDDNKEDEKTDEGTGEKAEEKADEGTDKDAVARAE